MAMHEKKREKRFNKIKVLTWVAINITISYVFLVLAPGYILHITEEPPEKELVIATNLLDVANFYRVSAPQTDYTYYDIPLDAEIQNYVYIIADKYKVPAGLIFAIMDVESHFNANAISSTQDYGLCQINIVNHEWLKTELGLDNMFDPYQNVVACAYIYSSLLDITDGDVGLAAMCYNCGPAGAARLWEQNIYETDYSRKIMDVYEAKYK